MRDDKIYDKNTLQSVENCVVELKCNCVNCEPSIRICTDKAKSVGILFNRTE